MAQILKEDTIATLLFIYLKSIDGGRKHTNEENESNGYQGF